MHRVIQRGAKRLQLPKPANYPLTYKYGDNGTPDVRRSIDDFLNRTPTISSIINGITLDNPMCNESEYNHKSPYEPYIPNEGIRRMNVVYRANMLSKQALTYGFDSNTMKLAAKHWNQIGLDKRIEHFQNIASYIEDNRNGVKDSLIAATFVGQGKSVYEADIDICELIDFLNFNNYYATQMNNRELIQGEGEVNMTEINGLDGFIASITPFNFTAIGANLVSVPLLMGNPVLWKPSQYSLLSNKLYYDIMLKNNIPPELIWFVVMDGQNFMDVVSKRHELSGIAFTGSSQVFNSIYRKVGDNVHRYDNYPRLVGETGGKNFHFVHPSADPKLVAEKTFHSTTGYRGQKCSACSRLYVPKSLWPSVCEELKYIGEYYHNHHTYDSYGKLIDDEKYKKLMLQIDLMDQGTKAKVIRGYDCKTFSSMGLHLIISDDHSHRIFQEEFFAPVLGVYVYDDEKVKETLALCLDKTNNKYALTGSIFAHPDDDFIEYAFDEARFNAGNFYINDKSTGSVVGRQPFGGAGKSGTNDKAGDINLLYRFANPRSVKVNTQLN